LQIGRIDRDPPKTSRKSMAITIRPISVKAWMEGAIARDPV
jgi:hypothetical protein